MTDQEIAEIFLDHASVSNSGYLTLPRVNALGFARAVLARQEQEIVALHSKLAGETLRANQGWQRWEAANNVRLKVESQLAAYKDRYCPWIDPNEYGQPKEPGTYERDYETYIADNYWTGDHWRVFEGGWRCKEQDKPWRTMISKAEEKTQ